MDKASPATVETVLPPGLGLEVPLTGGPIIPLAGKCLACSGELKPFRWNTELSLPLQTGAGLLGPGNGGSLSLNTFFVPFEF